MILQFGKYKGQEIDATPTAYLKWLEENASNLTVQEREKIQEELKIRSSEETSIGRSLEGPGFKSLEEMLYTELIKWLKLEVSAQRIIIIQADEQTVQASLCNHLKSGAPRLLKLFRAQTRQT
jgi:hypothetical protein